MTVLQKVTAADHSDLLAKARDVVPAIREMGHDIAKARHVPKAVVDILADAGLMHLGRPEAYGGPDVDPEVLFNIARILGEADGSVAWFYSITQPHDHLAGLYSKEAQDVYWNSEQPLCASSYVPAGKATKAPGGWRLSGKWSFCSGIDHCGWVVVGTVAVVPGDEKPSVLLMLLPKHDVELVDDWFAMGLAGSGSKSIVVNDVFVPDAYVLNNSDVMTGNVPGAKVNDSPLYRTSIWPLFGFSVLSPATGILRGAYNAILEDCRAKVRANDPMFAARKVQAQTRLAEASARLESSELLYEQSLSELMSLVRADAPIPLELKVRNRRNHAYIARTCREGMDVLMQMAGARGIREENAIQRATRDIFAISAHVGSNWDLVSASYGSVMLGGEPLELFI